MSICRIIILFVAGIVLTACAQSGTSHSEGAPSTRVGVVQSGSHKYPTINGVRQLSGEEIVSLISDRSVVGYYESSSGSHVDFFASDGRFASSVFDGSIHHGSWTIDVDRVCITVADEPPSRNRCITFVATKDQFVAFRPGGKGIYRITGIKSGNFKNLPLE